MRRWTFGAASAAICLSMFVGCLGSGSKLVVSSWTASRPLSDTDQVIPISILHGACDTLLPVTVDETADRVTITATAREKNVTCIAMGVATPESVQLEQPLGARQLQGCQPERQGGCRAWTLGVPRR